MQFCFPARTKLKSTDSATPLKTSHLHFAIMKWIPKQRGPSSIEVILYSLAFISVAGHSLIRTQGNAFSERKSKRSLYCQLNSSSENFCLNVQNISHVSKYGSQVVGFGTACSVSHLPTLISRSARSPEESLANSSRLSPQNQPLKPNTVIRQQF